MIEKRAAHAAVEFRGNIYTFGGFDQNNKFLNTAEVFNTETKQFSSILQMRTPRARFAAALSGCKVFCFGGYTSIKRNARRVAVKLHTVESFNICTGKWKDEENAPKRTGDYAAVTIFID